VKVLINVDDLLILKAENGCSNRVLQGRGTPAASLKSRARDGLAIFITTTGRIFQREEERIVKKCRRFAIFFTATGLARVRITACSGALSFGRSRTLPLGEILVSSLYGWLAGISGNIRSFLLIRGQY
jgi:hypothetical protein